MCRVFYIFILLPIFLISQTEKEVPLGSEKAPSYVKNQSDHVIVSGEFSEKLKSRNGKMFLYEMIGNDDYLLDSCLLYTSPSPRDRQKSRMPSSA